MLNRSSQLPRYEAPPPWIPINERKGHPLYDNDVNIFLPRNILIERSNPQASLGFHIRGGVEHLSHVYISKVLPSTQAERLGLNEGDEIISANGISFENLSHSEAVHVLKNSNKVELIVKYFPYGYRLSYN